MLSLHCDFWVKAFLFVSVCSTDYRLKFEVERKEPESFNSTSGSLGTQQQQQHQHPPPLLPTPQQHPFPSSAGQAVPSSVTVVAPAHLPDSTTESWSNYYSNHREGKLFNKGTPVKHRCRDYDGKGSPLGYSGERLTN